MQTQIVPIDGEKPTVVVVAAAAPIVVVQQDIANSMDYVAFQNLNNVNSLEFKQGKDNDNSFLTNLMCSINKNRVPYSFNRCRTSTVVPQSEI